LGQHVPKIGRRLREVPATRYCELWKERVYSWLTTEP